MCTCIMTDLVIKGKLPLQAVWKRAVLCQQETAELLSVK